MVRREGTSGMGKAAQKIIPRGVQLLNVINGFGEEES